MISLVLSFEDLLSSVLTCRKSAFHTIFMSIHVDKELAQKYKCLWTAFFVVMVP